MITKTKTTRPCGGLLFWKHWPDLAHLIPSCLTSFPIPQLVVRLRADSNSRVSLIPTASINSEFTRCWASESFASLRFASLPQTPFFPSSPARDATAGLLIAKTVCNWCSWRKRWEYLRVYWPLCLIWPLMSEVNGALQAGHRGGNPDLWFYHCSSCWKQQVGGL